ncbi:nucleoside hydrolase [Micropruina sp.]|uniref:nucleoside hydrolase n=1 Tax=Micropruina sp. TaxID=2737536 RepID=UPI0039E3DA78
MVERVETPCHSGKSGVSTRSTGWPWGRLDVPVAVGAMHPLIGKYDGGVPHMHGRNVELPHTAKQPEVESAERLVRPAHQHEGELDVIAIGPLTNLALAQDPSIVHRVHQVVIMGGAALVPGNLTPVAEANIGNDTEAA